jgi:ketosteroid isomerase-like protein
VRAPCYDPRDGTIDKGAGRGVDMALNPKAETTLREWHRMVAAQDLSRVEDLCAPDAVFRSPVAFTPYRGSKLVAAFLQQAVHALSDFRYHRTFVGGDSDVVLEFSAVVDGKQLKGIDMIHFGADGRIEEFEVMVRPASGLQALGAEMQRRMTPLLAAAKG